MSGPEKLRDVVEDRLCVCANCEWSGPEKLVLPDIPDYFERVDPDEPEEPAGECPECRCLCWYEEDE